MGSVGFAVLLLVVCTMTLWETGEGQWRPRGNIWHRGNAKQRFNPPSFRSISRRQGSGEEGDDVEEPEGGEESGSEESEGEGSEGGEGGTQSLEELMPECPARIPILPPGCIECDSELCEKIVNHRCCEECCLSTMEFDVQEHTGCPYASLSQIFRLGGHLELLPCGEGEEDCQEGFTCCDNSYHTGGTGSSCYNNNDLWVRGGVTEEEKEEELAEPPPVDCKGISVAYKCRYEATCFYGCFEIEIGNIVCLCTER